LNKFRRFEFQYTQIFEDTKNSLNREENIDY